VEFSWDADVNAEHAQDDDDSYLWTRAVADEVTTGVVTPLTYSCRYVHTSEVCWSKQAALLGFPDLAKMRAFKYWKGELYYNGMYEKLFVERTGWPALRGDMLAWIPPIWHEEVKSAPFNPLVWVR